MASPSMISRCLATRGALNKPQVPPQASETRVQLVEANIEVPCAGVHIISNLKALALSIALAMVTSLVRLILASSLATSSPSLLIRSSSRVGGAHRGVGRTMSSAATRDVVTAHEDSHTEEEPLLKSTAYESKVAKLRQMLDRGGRAAAMHVITDFDLTLTAPGSLQCHHMFGRYEQNIRPCHHLSNRTAILQLTLQLQTTL
eukprot:20500-Heterococcus_DN1.PRE.4